MMPPTYLTSLEVAQYAGPAEVVDAAHGRTVEMHTPGRRGAGGGLDAVRPRAPAVPARRPHVMTEAWAGGSFGERARCLLAPNPGMMTLDGTNSWVLIEPGASRSVVIDPGPIEDGHVDELDEQTGDVALVLLTHHHFDHSEVAVDFATRKGCPVRALDPAYCFNARPARRRRGHRRRRSAGCAWSRTPGHTADSISLMLPAERALLSGDMVLGRGTTVVAYPDGQLGPYFDSIERMRALAVAGEVDTHLAGPRPGARRRARHPGPLPRAPPSAAGPGRGRAGDSSASPYRTPRTRSCPARSSRSSTRTSTSRCGARPSGRSGLSSRTWPRGTPG